VKSAEFGKKPVGSLSAPYFKINTPPIFGWAVWEVLGDWEVWEGFYKVFLNIFNIHNPYRNFYKIFLPFLPLTLVILYL